MRDFEPPKRVQITIKNLFIVMAYVLILTMFLAVNYYYKRYLFFGEHISNLGTMDPLNLKSMIIMIVGFGFNSLLMIIVSIIYFVKRKQLKGWKVKGPLALVIAIGAAGVAIPLNHPQLNILHKIGAACFIGGFAVFNAYLQITSSYHKRFKKDEKTGKIIKKEVEARKVDTAWDIFLSIVVLTLLIIYFTFFAIVQLEAGAAFLGPIFQKIVVFVEILALYFIDNKDA